jgi:diguanylate cyclase (GGDEF)-like protein
VLTSPVQDSGKTRERSASGATTALRTVLLAGAEALALRGQIETYAQGARAGGEMEVVTAESILECVLIAGSDAERDVPLILAGVSQELEQLESAISSLRKVYTRSRIVLLCDPSDEVICRKARAWGATDYLILPADARSLQRLFVIPPVAGGARGFLRDEAAGIPGRPFIEIKANGHVAEPGATIEKSPTHLPAAGATTHVEEVRVPGLPLMVQTALFNEVLAGRTDFIDRAVQALQNHVAWHGTLSFVPAPTTAGETIAPIDGEIHAPVIVPGHASFGTLVLMRSDAASTKHIPPELAQSAQWLATLLSVGHRYEQLRTLAVTDELSGAYNRRYFNKFVTGLLDRARASRFRVTLLLFDIDDFKKYNDSFGHASGDAIIRELIGLLRSCTRPDDLVARLGGDEFAVVYWDNEARRQPNSEHPRDLLAATERFRKAIKSHAWSQKCNIQGSISISGGLATFPWDADSLDQLMAKADEALLRAKRAGKNVILLHHHDGPQVLPDPAV